MLIENRLVSYKKSINTLIAETDALVAQCCAADFHCELTPKLEKKAYELIAKRARVYQLVRRQHQALYKKFVSSASGKQKLQLRSFSAYRLVPALRQYLYLQINKRKHSNNKKHQFVVERLRSDVEYFSKKIRASRRGKRSVLRTRLTRRTTQRLLSARRARANLRLTKQRLTSLKEQRALRFSKKPAATLNAVSKKLLPLKKKVAFKKGTTPLLKKTTVRFLPSKKAKSFLRTALVFPFIPTTSYFTQFFVDFLPEMTLTFMITAILAQVAIALGQGQSKKALAFASLVAFRQGLTFIIALYLLQFAFISTHSVFNGYVVVSEYVVGFKLLVAYSGRFILSESELYLKNHSRHLLEYPVAMTLAILFMLLLVGSVHLVSAFLALVGFSLNLYVLILFDATHVVAREAGIKYFYLSAMSSGLMLYGIFLIFLILGTGHFHEIGQLLSTESALAGLSGGLLHLALVFLLIGLFFKLSAFPGHL